MWLHILTLNCHMPLHCRNSCFHIHSRTKIFNFSSWLLTTLDSFCSLSQRTPKFKIWERGSCNSFLKLIKLHILSNRLSASEQLPPKKTVSHYSTAHARLIPGPLSILETTIFWPWLANENSLFLLSRSGLRIFLENSHAADEHRAFNIIY